MSPNAPMIGKVAVMGLLERNAGGDSKIRLEVVAGRKKHHLRPSIEKHVEHGANVHTDAHPSYEQIANAYVHNVIDHAEAYVNGNVHTNGLENFWSLLKRTLGGTYVSVEPFHLFRCLDEQAFRFNNRREMNDADRFSHVVRHVVRRRVMYKDLIGATSPNVP